MNCRSKMVKDLKDLVLSKVSGINSGMVINTPLFEKVRYNEELFLDYVDYDFMRRVHGVNARIAIMNSWINQEFQFFNYDKSNMSGALFRFKVDMHDYKILCRETGEIFSSMYIQRIYVEANPKLSDIRICEHVH